MTTRTPFVADNNLAELALEADMRVGGSLSRPDAAGRVTLEDGGVLRLNGRTYEVERLVLSFTG